MKKAIIGFFVISLSSAFSVEASATNIVDLVIYGSTPAGLAAAVQAKRMGLTAQIVSPEHRIGGLTTGGLGQTDIGNKKAFGGIAVEFYRDIAIYYSNEKNWKHQKSEDYFPEGQCAGTRDNGTMWTFEPSAALSVLENWVARNGLKISRGERLDRTAGGVIKKGEKIVAFRTESGKVYRGKFFIDATYEGDLMAGAGVSYVVGRESNSKYGETLNGNAPNATGSKHHNFHKGVSAYVTEGDPKSGLLPGVEAYNPKSKVGQGDSRVQAYCFRMCLTDVPNNRIKFKKPANYNEKNYELLFREFAAVKANPKEKILGCLYGLSGSGRIPFIVARMPNRKTDANNRTAFSSDFIGQNWAWAEASYQEREKIFNAHLEYQKGLMWTLENHPRIPKDVRAYFSRWGMCRDEFLDGPGDGWQSQLYIREARRMVSDVVLTEHNCRGTKIASRPIALAAYAMDSHHVRRIATKEGFVRNEGNFEDHLSADKTSRMKPWGIDYGAIVPKRGECENLFAPVTLSASHVAYGSLRMEPVFFALGQAAATAAAFAIEDGVSVQDVDYKKLSSRLLCDGQVITWK